MLFRSGTTRATRWGRIANYPKRAESELCVLLQVETVQALDNLEAIAAVEGVDGIFVGPADLHASMGHVGERHHPQVWDRIEDAIQRIRAAGRAPGFLTSNETDARRILELGGQFVAVGSDAALLASAADADEAVVRRLVEAAILPELLARETATALIETIEADAVVKGQTASSSYKPAIVEGGIRVMVPPHIAVGTKLVINTEDGSYMERAKD